MSHNYADMHKADSEKQRLDGQSGLLVDFSAPAYDRLLKGKQGLTVLDVGCSEGSQAMYCLGRRSEISCLFGVDNDAPSIEAANERYASENIVFRCADCETDQLSQVLDAFLAEKGIAGFDIINISMVILHLQDPLSTLCTLRRYLVEGGALLIIDVDDGFTLAGPDPDGRFAKIRSMFDYLDGTGRRDSGRHIPWYLDQAGFRNIQLDRCGMTVVGMNAEEREVVYETCIDRLAPCFEMALASDPDNKQLQDEYDWMKNNLPDMKKQFMHEGFFYSGGFMLFTASA